MGEKMIKNKKSQATLFIIIAVVLIAGIVLFFLLKNKISIPGTTGMPDIQAEMEKCVSDSASKAADIIMPQGGYLQPENYKLYQGIKIAYLCYNKNYYQTCINQQPLYLQHLKSEIKSYISGKIEDCFYSQENDLKNKGYQTEFGTSELNVDLIPGKIEIGIDKKISIIKNEESRNYEKFSFEINSPLYDLAVIAQEAVNQESKFCYFEYLGYQLLHPEYSIEKIDINGETKLYFIKEKSSNKQLNLAVRSCAMPAGI